MRLIDVDNLLHFIEVDKNIIAPERYRAWDIIEMIKSAPIVDAIPVVRCEDCEQAEDQIPAMPDVLYCNEWDTLVLCDGYCHHGKKDNVQKEFG